MNKILYIGANLHIDPIKDFQDTREFILIDSAPRNEYGFVYYYRPFYNKYFMTELIESFKSIGFYLSSKEVFTNLYEEIDVSDLDSACLTFYNKDQARIVKYYISTGIPSNLHNNTILIKDLSNCDTILISGHYPNSQFMEYISIRPITIIGYPTTHFPQDLLNQDNDDIISFIFKYPTLFDLFIKVDDNNKHYYTNYESFSNSI